MSYLVGINPTEIIATAALLEGRGYKLGDRGRDASGKLYIYVQADGAITAAGYTCTIGEDYQAAMITSTNGLYGDKVGVPAAAFADNEYGWMQVDGPCTIRGNTSAAANARINTTATAGLLDDDATGGTKSILGAALTTAVGGAADTVAGILTNPVVGVTL